MARVAAAGRTGSALTTVLGPQLISGVTTQDLVVREIGVFNTSTTGFPVAVCRTTAQGTPGTAVTATNIDTVNHTTIGDVTNIGTGAATVGTAFRQATLGAAIGSGVIWTFGENGLIVDGSTTLGITIICATGTGQIVDWYFEWTE
jgi:hypothetical protein